MAFDKLTQLLNIFDTEFEINGLDDPRAPPAGTTHTLSHTLTHSQHTRTDSVMVTTVWSRVVLVKTQWVWQKTQWVWHLCNDYVQQVKGGE